MKKINFLFSAIEWFIVALLLLTIACTFWEIFWVIIKEVKHHNLIHHYKTILSEILLLAVGVEIALLIIKKDLYFVIDILILAMARKLITYDDNMEVFLSVLCILLLLVAKIAKKKLIQA